MGDATARLKGESSTERQAAKRAISASAAKVATVSLGELRSNFKAIEAKLAKGMRVHVTRRGEPVAEVLPIAPMETGVASSFADRMPEFMARLREIWGPEPLDIDTTRMVSEGRHPDLLS